MTVAWSTVPPNRLPNFRALSVSPTFPEPVCEVGSLECEFFEFRLCRGLRCQLFAKMGKTRVGDMEDVLGVELGGDEGEGMSEDIEVTLGLRRKTLLRVSELRGRITEKRLLVGVWDDGGCGAMY
jgi:hypothetical protein